MRKIFPLLLLTLFSVSATAQPDRIPINVCVPEDDLPAEAHTMLVTKLNQIVTNYGLANNGLTDRFFLTANVLVTTKDIMPGTPPRVSQKADVVLFIGDVIDNKIYGSLSLTIIGVGQNENKAFINAFQKMPVKSKALEDFMDSTKEKIVLYYQQNGNALIDNAEFLAKSGQYDEALATLLSIPDFCGEISVASQEAVLKVFQMKIDNEGEELLKQAQLLWAANQNEEIVPDVLGILQGIHPDSSSSSGCDALMSKMTKYLNSKKAQNERSIAEAKSKVEEQEKKEWDFKMRQYEDHLELQRQMLKDQTSIEKARIEAEKISAERKGRIDINKVTKTIKSWGE